MFNNTFLSKCAESKFQIPDKSIAGNSNQPYFRLTLPYSEIGNEYIGIKLPQSTLSVLYCMKMWCMLSTPPRSTLHPAVELLSGDNLH